MIDGYTIIDNWTSHRSTENSAIIYLDKGWHKIVIEYNDIGFDATVKLLWSSFSRKQDVVPSDHLSFMIRIKS